MARRRRRRGFRQRSSGGRRAALLFVLFVLVGLVALVVARRPLASFLIEAGLAAWEVQLTSLEVESLDSGGLVLANISLGDGTTRVARLSLKPVLSTSDWPRLALLRVEGLRLGLGVTSDGHVDSHGLAGLMARRATGSGNGTGNATPPLPERIEIDDAVLQVTTPAGTIEIVGGGMLGGAADGSSSLDFQIRPGDDLTRAAQVAGHIRVAPDPDRMLHLIWLAEAAHLSLGPLDVADSRLEGDLGNAVEGPLGTASAHLGTGSTLAGLRLSKPLDLRFALLEQATLTLAPGPMTASLAGTDVEITLPAATLETTPLPRLDAREGYVALGQASVSLEGMALQGALDDLHLTGRVVSRAAPPLLGPLLLDARIARNASGTAQLVGSLRSADATLNLALSGQHDPATGQGRADLKLAPLGLGAPLDLNMLAPGLGGGVKSAGGQIGLHLSCTWSPEGMTTGGEISLSDVDLDLGATVLARGNGVLHLASLWPLATQPDQHLAFAGLNLGVPLTDGRFDFALDPSGLLALTRASLGLAGGQVSLRETTLRPFDLPLNLALDVAGLDLGQVLGLAGLPGLAGEGKLGGEVPVIISTTGVAIPEAHLAAAAPGWLRYAPDVLPRVLQGDDPKIRLAVTALRDMRYERLTLMLSREAGGEATLRLSMKGRNPALRGGAPLEFNLNLEGRLDEIARSALAGWQVPDDIQRELKASSTSGSSGQPQP